MRGCVYVSTIGEDGTLRDKKLLGTLHMNTDFRFPGAFDICVDSGDRVFAATELGVQCIRSFGLVDVILPLPDNAIPKRLAMVGNRLYADCDGKRFSRKLKSSAKEDPLASSVPKHCLYYD